MRNIRRSSFLSAAAGALAIAVLSGCGGTAPAAAPDGPVEITFSSWLKGSADVVEAYNAAQDEVHVTFQEVPTSADNYPQLSNQVKAKTAPDVITVEYPRVAEMATQGVLKDITKEAGGLVSKEFSPSIQSLVNFGGATWGVPLDAGVLQMYYRADLFEKYGIEVPTTWDEYSAAAAKVAAADPKVRLASSPAADPALLAGFAWQHGAQWSSLDGDAWTVRIDDEATVEAMNVQQELLDAKLLWTEDAPVLQQKQTDGQLLSVISGAWYGGALMSSFGDQAGKWRVAPLPSNSDKPASAMYGGSTFGISSTSDKPEAGVKFIQWMTTTEAGMEARLSGKSSVFPVNETARAAAFKAFDPSFFGGQDIYEVAGEGLESIPEGWVWGPATVTTFTSLVDSATKVKEGTATIADGLPAAQKATVEDLKNRGIAVK